MSTTDDQQQDIQIESSTTTEQILQKRFEDAMQRRKERRKEVATSESTTIFNEGDIASSSIEEKDTKANIETETSDTKDTAKNIDIESQSTNVNDENNEDDKPISTQGRHKEASYNGYNYRENSRRSSKTIQSSNKMNISGENEIVGERQRYNRYSKDEYDDPNNAYGEDLHDDNIYDDDEYEYYDDDEGYSTSTRPSSKPTAPQCEWETYQSTSILFPPPQQQLNLDQISSSIDGIRRCNPKRPNAIIHFVGGTFFGSYPRKFYGSLLEDIACKCNAVVVATSIPLVLPGKGIVNKLEKWMFDDEVGSGDDGRRSRRSTKERGTKKNNPLDHLMLAETIQKEFNNVYRDVVLDEYCDIHGGADETNDVEDFMKSVPIIGMGHSLGARIQAISCSHPNISKRYLSMGKGNRLIRSGREGMIYLGFANWGASSSIPGLETLDRTVKKRKQHQQRKEEQSRRRRQEGVGRRDDVWNDRSRTRRRQRSSGYDEIIDENKRRRYSRYYDRYDAEDLDLADVFGDVVSSVTKGAQQIGEALTPEAEDLEFTPTPNDLWDDLSAPNGWYSQSSQSNLIVQFDEDPIDQGSRLARTLLTAYEAESEKLNTTKSSGVEEDEPLHDVKFARLSGGHLTPVTLQEGIANILPRGAVSLLSSSYNFVLKQFDDERTGKSSQKQRREVQDVADTVASYIASLNDSHE